MRKLTKQEKKAKLNASVGFRPFKNAYEAEAFEAGFIADLTYAQTKLDAYAAYMAGKITLAELEEVINQ